VLGRWIRPPLSRLVAPLVAWLAALGVRPDHATLLGLALAWIAGLAFAVGARPLGAVLLFLAGAADVADGAIARFAGTTSPRGALVDSMADHVGDFAIHGGLLLAALAAHRPLDAGLLFTVQFASTFGSHLRARAAVLGLELRDVGICTRTERILALLAGLALHALTPALVGLAIVTAASTAQRALHLLRAAQEQGAVRSSQPA
jgi:phosphatidylglycerophosphate synthase